MSTAIDESASEPDERSVETPETESPAERPVAPSRGRRRGRASGRPRLIAAGALGAVLAVGLGFAAWSVPAVRTELLMSFTQQQQPYAELYFTTMPTFEGATVLVPVAITDHGEGAKGYQLTVTLEGPGGQVVDRTTVQLAARYNAPAPTILKLQAKSQVTVVKVTADPVAKVTLGRQPLSLYYRFGKVQLPDR